MCAVYKRTRRWNDKVLDGNGILAGTAKYVTVLEKGNGDLKRCSRVDPRSCLK